ncbi:AAA family ATPase [Halostagnicola kamekurae]|uniref:AAA ATPase domain-containing protein n=1 Tax=Halostagnicola kamekurae TaxID=619731 RepID=A0A1I6USE8_9EURY|nr:AAA family ATPase [Halostagnicola kamekurae]SFT04381.1 AAA ATPase domain-containing protein [Halostagnicola kamekurae]
MVRVKSFRIQNYRSIIDSGTVSLEENVTKIVGPNEAGKTNILDALSSFNVQRDYKERELSNYVPDSNKDSPTPVVTVTFEDLSVEEAPFAPAFSKISHPDSMSTTATLIKYFNGDYAIKYDGSEISIEQQMRSQFRDMNDKIGDLSEELRELGHLSQHDLYSNISKQIQDILQSNNRFSRASLDDFESIDELSEEAFRSMEQHSQFIEDDQKMVEIEESTIRLKSLTSVQKNLLRLRNNPLKELSLFTYLTDFGLFPDSVGLDSIQDESYTGPYVDLLEYAKLTPDELEHIDPGETHRRRQEVEERLNNDLNRHWVQGEIEVQIELTSSQVGLQIYDETGEHTVPSDRSTGFRWFLSFYLSILAGENSKVDKNILLLDDPGVHLHPYGLKRLRESLDSFGEETQLVYSTHSPFLLESNEIDNIRLLKRESSNGTQVYSLLEAPDPVDRDALAPVRTSLGATMAESLFTGSATVLVEGVSDKYYLEGFSDFFAGDRKLSLKPGTNIIDVSGSKAVYFAKLVDAEGFEFVILLDDDNGGSNQYENLIDSGISSDKVVFVSDAIDRELEADAITIEDLLPPELLYREVSDHTPATFDQLGEPPEADKFDIVSTIEGRLNELKGRGEIDKSHLSKDTIANSFVTKLVEGDYTEENLDERSVERFEKLIKEINESLSK